MQPQLENLEEKQGASEKGTTSYLSLLESCFIYYVSTAHCSHKLNFHRAHRLYPTGV